MAIRMKSEFGADMSLLSISLFADGPVTDRSSLLVAVPPDRTRGRLYDKEYSSQFNTSTVQGGPGGGPGGGGGGPGGGGG